MKGVQNYDKYYEYEEKLKEKFNKGFKDIFQEYYFTRGLGLAEISKIIDVPLSSLDKYFTRTGLKRLQRSELLRLKEKDLTDKKCVYCGNFIAYYRKDKDTCNHVCARKLGQKNAKLEKINQRRGKQYFCQWCGKEITDITKPVDYCSKSCRTHAQHKKAGHIKQEYICKHCGKNFSVVKYRNTKYCSEKCMYEDITSDVTKEDIIKLVTDFYNKTGYCLPRDEIAIQLNTTRKVIERRIGTICNLYAELGFKYSRKTSKLAPALFNLIDNEYNIKGIREKSFSSLRNPKTSWKLRFDYYISDKNIALEYNGKQHYNKNSGLYLKKDTPIEKVNKTFEDIQFRDNIKKEWCKENNITLIVWKYDKPVTLENIHETFDKYLKNK